MKVAQESQEERDTSQHVAERVEHDASKAMSRLKKKPALGAVLAGGLGFVAASVIGVGEVAVAIAAGYAAYRALTA